MRISRSNALAYARVAGYHNDMTQFIRALIEGRASRESMNEVWRPFG